MLAQSIQPYTKLIMNLERDKSLRASFHVDVNGIPSGWQQPSCEQQSFLSASLLPSRRIIQFAQIPLLLLPVMPEIDVNLKVSNSH
jgi:hypothetical protein